VVIEEDGKTEAQFNQMVIESADELRRLENEASELSAIIASNLMALMGDA
jgi:hypothetical protein